MPGLRRSGADLRAGQAPEDEVAYGQDSKPLNRVLELGHLRLLLGSFLVSLTSNFLARRLGFRPGGPATSARSLHLGFELLESHLKPPTSGTNGRGRFPSPSRTVSSSRTRGSTPRLRGTRHTHTGTGKPARSGEDEWPHGRSPEPSRLRGRVGTRTGKDRGKRERRAS